MEKTRQERIELHDRLVAMLEGVRRDLKSRFPEIVSVDLGLKERRGELTHEFSWRVFVKEKKAESDLRPGQMIPKEVAGIPTDVQTVKLKRVHADDEPYTLAGGVQIAGGGGYGSLGCFVTVGAGTAVHLMGNHHVLGANGKLVGSPGAACDLCCCKCCEVAIVVNGVEGVEGNDPGNTADAGIAILVGQTAGDSKTIPYTNMILEIGPIFGSGTPAVDDVVRKRGPASGLTTGRIASITEEPLVDLGTGIDPVIAEYHDCIEVISQDGVSEFTKLGDSGAAVVNATGQVIGLHFSGSGPSSSLCKIPNISAKLGGITILSSGTAETVPNINYMVAPVVAAHPTYFLQVMERKLKETTCGTQFLQVIHENHREVLDLINDNREVKIAWNRFQGPAFVGHIAKNANDTGHPIPPNINGYSLQNLLIKMNDVLERNGSRKLAKAVEDYSLSAFMFLENYSGLQSLDGMLHREGSCPICGMPKNVKHYA
jgi:hypothetical protein